MPTAEDRIAALEGEVQLLRQQLLDFMNSSSKVVTNMAGLAAENALLSRAVTFLGIFWAGNPGIPKGLLADVYAAVMNDLDDDLIANAPRAVANLSFWTK